MIALVMAGGRGSRMGPGAEKLLAGRRGPVVMRVVAALRGSGCFEEVAAATSPNAPRAREALLAAGVRVIDTPGAGYSADLGSALARVPGPALVVSGDMPLLDAGIVRELVRRAGAPRGWTSFVVTRRLYESCGMRGGFAVRAGGQECRYTGASAVGPAGLRGGPGEGRLVVVDDRRIAASINTPRDLRLFGGA